LQLIESDRLDTPPGKLNDKRLRGGVEVDRYGAPLAKFLPRYSSVKLSPTIY